MTKKGSRIISWLLAVIICIGLVPISPVRAADAVSLSTARELLNSVELHPQRTGYPELDRMISELLCPFLEGDTYTKLKGLYDWIVEHIEYSWEGYSQTWAPAYDKFTLTYDLEYEEGLAPAIPEEVINRSYHTITRWRGVCYDYAALFAVMARYVGVESYVHTGYLKKGSWRGHHGWTELSINGTNYIFDPQQDYREWQAHRNAHAHFGIAPAASGRFTPEVEVNAARDAGFLPVTADRTLTPQPAPEPAAPEPAPSVMDEEWYHEVLAASQSVGLLSKAEADVFPGDDVATRADAVSLLARLGQADLTMYPGSSYSDVPNDSPDAAAIQWATQSGVVTGEGGSTFNPEGELTREQLLTIYMRYLTGTRGVTVTPVEVLYSDAGEISAWALPCVEQAESVGLVSGTGDGAFQPQRHVTQAETLTFLVRMAFFLAPMDKN